MKRSLLLWISVLTVFVVSAKPVGVNKAEIAASKYLLNRGIADVEPSLSLAKTYYCGADTACFYIFDFDHRGFMVVSADDRVTPILGYSVNNPWNEENPLLLQWLEDYRTSMTLGFRSNAPANPKMLDRWQKLFASVPNPAAKSDTYLLETTWEQGPGYNDFCPIDNGNHVVTGCVATAMSQIMRYHRFPNHGFGRATYVHSYYGMKSIDFDTSEYDYNLMPNHISYSSTREQRDMVSRLCYHAGVAVRMEYQNPSHTSGSGAHSNDVPIAFYHFGYVSSRYLTRPVDNNEWMSLLRSEIDSLRPVYYSGSNTDGGHAFVLDGYSTSQDLFHFNWGWGGYGDGFFSLSDLMGFTQANAAVVHIVPSGIDGGSDHLYVSPSGNGNATSWSQASSNINDAIFLAGIGSKDVWLQEGIYTANTNQEYLVKVNNAAEIYGGFAGTESALNDRNTSQHTTIFDGQHQQKLLCCTQRGAVRFDDVEFRNGYCSNGSVLTLDDENVSINHVTIRDCRSDSGSIVSMKAGLMRYVQILQNQAPVVLDLTSASLRQSIVAHNNGNALKLRAHSRVFNCDIVNNLDTGVVSYGQNCVLVNSVVWNNGVNYVADNRADSTIRYCAIQADSLVLGVSNIRLNADNETFDTVAPGPRFTQVSVERGCVESAHTMDLHLLWGSPCINSGVTLDEVRGDYDLDGKFRFRQGKIDMGPYETNYPVSIASVEGDYLQVYPNPASQYIKVTAPTLSPVLLYDAQGRLLCQYQIEGTQMVDVSELPAGCYFVSVGQKIGRLLIAR